MNEVHTNMKKIIFLGLGTNMGDRLANLATARAALEPYASLLMASSIYKTPPWGFTNQPEFLNQVLKSETDLSPARLLVTIKKIENELGREASFRWGPRLIDIDILFYNDLTLHEADLQIPHPRLDRRAFVLIPLAEIAPDLRHPISGSKIKELLAKIDPTGVEIFQSDQTRQ